MEAVNFVNFTRRHAELVSASTGPQAPSAQVKEWTLKQVQGDAGRVNFVNFANPFRHPSESWDRTVLPKKRDSSFRWNDGERIKPSSASILSTSQQNYADGIAQ